MEKVVASDVLYLLISGEGALLASGSADSTVKLWDVTANAKTSRAEER